MPMMRFLPLLILTGLLFAQEKATTDGGKIVILNEDGTWVFQKEKKPNQGTDFFGMWQVTYYVDDFGDYTDEGYIRNFPLIQGTFSNSATTNSELNVRFLIDDKVAIMLYEYANNHPVKGTTLDRSYNIIIKHNGNKVNTVFKASNSSDRAILNYTQSKQLIDLLKKGGKFQIFLNEGDRSSSYKFEIDNASGFTNAWQKLYGYIEENKLNEAKLNEAKINEAKLNLKIDLEKFTSVESALVRTKRAGNYYRYAIGKEKIYEYAAGTEINVYNIIRENMIFAGSGVKWGYIYKANLNLPSYFGELLPFSTPPQPLKDLTFKKPVFGQEGTIKLKIFVDRFGNVSPNVQLVEYGHYKLNQIALKEIVKVKFEPAKTKDGDPVGAWMEVSAVFQ